MSRTYKRDDKGKFAKGGGGSTGKKKKPKKKKTQRVANYRHTTTRALGDTSKDGNVSITRRGTRKRKIPVRQVIKVGGKPSKGTKKDKRIKKNKTKK